MTSLGTWILDRGITTDDVLHGLAEDWQFDRPPVFSRFHWQWKYYIDTVDVDGVPILIIMQSILWIDHLKLLQDGPSDRTNAAERQGRSVSLPLRILFITSILG